jgi:hypothetical protein
MRWLGKQLGYRRPSDWHGIAARDFKNNHGYSILAFFESSPLEAVKDLYPGRTWQEWLFNCAPQKFWLQSHNCTRYMRWLGKRLGYKKPEDWYQVSADDFKKNHGGALLSD